MKKLTYSMMTASALACTSAIAQDRPNIILFLVDDMGVMDTSVPFLTDAKGKKYTGLELFDFTVTEQEKTRNTADAIFSMGGQNKLLVGFINKCSEIRGVDTPLFQVKMGLGNENNTKEEGIRYRNFFGTHLTGPVLVKNPYFLKYLAESLCGKEMEDEYLIYEKKGYEITLRELRKRMEN